MQKNRHVALAAAIRKAGFRATKQRLLLLSFLQKEKYPVSIQELVDGLKKHSIDQVTVYRMIEAFARAGLVREIASLHGRPHYEFNDAASDHDHIVCSSCYRVEDFTGLHERGIEAKALKKSHSFSRINAHALTLYGLCNACAA